MKNNSLVTVKNNREGRRFIATLRKYLRNTPKGVRLFGRGPRPAYPRYQHSLPLGLAKHIAVYVQSKPKTRMVRVVIPQPDKVEWREVPTKWAGGVGKTYTARTTPLNCE